MLLVSFCENGSLLSQLIRRAASNDPFSTPEKLKLVCEVCTGMAYLASKHIIHRDLAARNVLIDVEWQARIADFGLSRETSASDSVSEYYRSSGGMVPVRWTVRPYHIINISKRRSIWIRDVFLLSDPLGS